MKESPTQKPQKSSTTAVHVIAIISLVCFIIGEIVIPILASVSILAWSYWLSFNITGIIELILLFSLDSALDRISVLENTLLGKGVIQKKELEPEPEIEDIDVDAKGIKFCKKCDYQLFPEDKVCPYCGAKVEED